MEKLKLIKESLVGAIEEQVRDLSSVDAKELGEVVDMVKDISETIYYCTVVDAMKENSGQENRHYMDKYLPEYYQDMGGRGERYYSPSQITTYESPMYYGGGYSMYASTNSTSSGRGNGGTSSDSSGGSRYHGGGYPYHPMPYEERGMGMPYYPMNGRDMREGRSSMSRKTYIESKQMQKGKDTQMHELEKYLHELSEDVTELVHDASAEEKQMLQQKIATLASKIK